MCKVVSAIVMLATQSIHKYSTMFVVPSGLRENLTGADSTVIVDLNYVRFTVKRDQHGVRQFATWVAGALANMSGNVISPDQVLDVLDDIERLGEYEHPELDMLLAGYPGCGSMDANRRFTVNGWRKTQNGMGINPRVLDETKNLHKDGDLLYWPFGTSGAATRKVSTVALVMADARVTGQIKISTAFLNAARRPEFARDFEAKLTNALSTSYTTERVIAKQPTDIMSTNPDFPYLVPTERAKYSTHQICVTNQQFISRAHYESTEEGERGKHRENEILHPIASVTNTSRKLTH